MLSKELVMRKLGLIQEDLLRLTELSGFSLDEVLSDFLKQNTLERLLEKIIMRAVDVNEHLLAECANEKVTPPKTYRETFTELAKIGVYGEEFGRQIGKSIGLRNLLVNEYDQGVDHAQLYHSVGDCLREYHAYCGFILKYLETVSQV